MIFLFFSNGSTDGDSYGALHLTELQIKRLLEQLSANAELSEGSTHSGPNYDKCRHYQGHK